MFGNCSEPCIQGVSHEDCFAACKYEIQQLTGPADQPYYNGYMQQCYDTCHLWFRPASDPWPAEIDPEADARYYNAEAAFEKKDANLPIEKDDEFEMASSLLEDDDEDDVISREEWEFFFSRIAQNGNRMLHAFGDFDTNGDGYINKTEANTLR